MDADDWVLMRGNYTGSRSHPSGDHTYGVGNGLFFLNFCFPISLFPDAVFALAMGF